MYGRAGLIEKELSTRSLDYTATILDEVALEGLDGITLQGGLLLQLRPSLLCVLYYLPYLNFLLMFCGLSFHLTI